MGFFVLSMSIKILEIIIIIFKKKIILLFLKKNWVNIYNKLLIYNIYGFIYWGYLVICIFLN